MLVLRRFGTNDKVLHIMGHKNLRECGRPLTNPVLSGAVAHHKLPHVVSCFISTKPSLWTPAVRLRKASRLTHPWVFAGVYSSIKRDIGFAPLYLV